MYDIRDYGYTDGMADAGPAIQAAIAATPDRIANGDRPARSHIVLLPQPATGEITVQTKVEIPTAKSVELRGEGAHSSVLVRWAGGGGYWLRINQGYRVAAVRNLNMNDGGIEIEGDTRNHWGVFDSTFRGVPEWAIKTLGPSVIGGTLSNVLIADSTNGIYFANRQSDLNVLNNIVFLKIPGTALRLRTSGVHAVDCDFEICGLPLHLDEKYPDFAFGDLRFTRCRFGPEHPSPKYEILAGKENKIGKHYISDVVFSQCLFRSNPESADEGRAVLKLTNPVQRMQFIGCYFWPTYTAFAEEDYLQDPKVNQGRDNVIMGVQPEMGFTQGGMGWTQIPEPTA
jgi:hypothetical protein